MPCMTLLSGEVEFVYPEERPMIILSFASSLDGYIASSCGDTEISSFEDKVEVHKLRSKVDAILVGINTILTDNPHLTVSEKYYKSDRHPIRIVLDSKCRIPLSAEVIRRRPEVKTIIATSSLAPKEKIEKLRNISNVDVLVLGEKKVDIKNLVEILYDEYGIKSMMVEGGGYVLGSFISEELYDLMRISYAPIIYGGGTQMFRGVKFCGRGVPKLKLIRIELCGQNIVYYFRR